MPLYGFLSLACAASLLCCSSSTHLGTSLRQLHTADKADRQQATRPHNGCKWQSRNKKQTRRGETAWTPPIKSRSEAEISPHIPGRASAAGRIRHEATASVPRDCGQSRGHATWLQWHVIAPRAVDTSMCHSPIFSTHEMEMKGPVPGAIRVTVQTEASGGKAAGRKPPRQDAAPPHVRASAAAEPHRHAPP